MRPDRIIDMHSHVFAGDSKTYATTLAREAEKLNIEKIVVLGLESSYWAPTVNNDNTLAAYRECPELIIPFAGIDPDWPVDPARVDSLRDQGFVGLKFIIPKVSYHDESLFPWYERAQELNMPVLFHLGIVARGHDNRRIDNNLMRPVFLDTVARCFPDLTLIGAHLGNPWYDEAGMSCRWNPNLYFDLSGSTLKKKSAEFLGNILWWGGDTYPTYADKQGRSAWEKILFGSDVRPEDIHDVVNDYQRILDELELPREVQDAVFYSTAEKLLQEAGIL